MDEEQRRRVVVVGAGISGLVAARQLNRARPGDEIIVLEGTDRVGGKLRVGSVGGLAVDVGAESVLARRPEALALIDEAGLGADLVHPAVAAAAVLARGRLHRLPPATVMGVPTRASLPALAEILDPAELARVEAEPGRPAPALTEDTDVASWVAGRMGAAVVDRLVEPLLGGVYAGHADRLSLQATVPALWERARRGGPLLGAEAGGRNGGPGRAGAGPGGPAPGGPAPGGPVFAGLRGGVGRLPEVLAGQLERAGVTIRPGTVVRGLRRTPRGWRLETGAASSPDHLEADAVILAAPAAAAARLLAADVPAAGTELAQIESAGVAVVAVALPAAQFAGVSGSGLLIPPVEGTAIKAATFSSAKWDWVSGPGDPVVVRLSLGRAGQEQALQRADPDLAALAVADLAAVLGRPLQPLDVAVTRWGGGLPQYAVGHLARIARIRAAVARAGRLAVCGAYLDGVGIPACIAAAGRAVRELGPLDPVDAADLGAGSGGASGRIDA